MKELDLYLVNEQAEGVIEINYGKSNYYGFEYEYYIRHPKWKENRTRFYAKRYYEITVVPRLCGAKLPGCHETKTFLYPWTWINFICNKFKEIDKKSIYVFISSRPKEINIDDPLTLRFCLAEDLVEIATLTKTDEAEIQKAKEKDAERRILSAIYMEPLKEILKKHGMIIRQNGYKTDSPDLKGTIHFAGDAKIKTILYGFLEATLLKELKQLGLNVELDNSKRSISSATGLFKLKDITIDTLKDEQDD